jgi:hypothetical protein
MCFLWLTVTLSLHCRNAYCRVPLDQYCFVSGLVYGFIGLGTLKIFSFARQDAIVLDDEEPESCFEYTCSVKCMLFSIRFAYLFGISWAIVGLWWTNLGTDACEERLVSVSYSFYCVVVSSCDFLFLVDQYFIFCSHHS